MHALKSLPFTITTTFPVVSRLLTYTRERYEGQRRVLSQPPTIYSLTPTFNPLCSTTAFVLSPSSTPPETKGPPAQNTMNPHLAELLSATHLFPFHPILRDYSAVTNGAEAWIALGGRGGRSRELEAARCYRPSEFPNINVLNETMRYPDWHDFEKFWRDYVPDGLTMLSLSGAHTAEWFFLGFHRVEQYMSSDEPTRLSRPIGQLICKDFATGKKVLQLLQPHGKLTVREVLGGYHTSELLNANGLEEVGNALIKARVKMLDLIGAIAFSYAHISGGTQTFVSALYHYGWLRWGLASAPKLGFLLDLHDSQHLDLPLFKLREHEVPIYFSADEAYQPRLPLHRRIEGGVRVDEESFAALVDLAVRSANPDDPLSQTPWQHAVANALSEEELLAPAVPETRTGKDTFIASSIARIASIWFFDKEPGAGAILGLPWSEGILDHAVLVISALEEVKLRLWARKYRVAEAADILTEAVQRGMVFRLVLPYDIVTRYNALANEPMAKV